MRHGRIRRSLEERRDGTLPEERRLELEAHLRECASCRREAERLDALLARAGDLPRSIEPPRDLWPEIVARMGPEGGEARARGEAARAAAPEGRGRVWAGAAGRGRGLRIALGDRTLASVQPWLAAAAILLVALSSATTALLVTRSRFAAGREAALAARAEEEAALIAASTEGWPGVEGGYLRAASELRRTLEAVSDRLDPATLAAVERNLRVIDAAILEAREALAADPESSEKLLMLASMYEKKLDVLRQVTGVRAGT